MVKDCSVIILAAGFSSRMKSPKFALAFDDKRTFIEKIVQEYHNFKCKEIICVLNPEGIKIKDKLKLSFSENTRFILNEYPEKERFFSLQTGLKAMQSIDFVFIQNIDNPFVNQEVLTNIYKAKTKADYIIPTFNNKGGHPILINRKIRESIIIEKNEKRILKDFLKNYNKITIESSKFLLLNINSNEEYNNLLYEKLLGI